MPELHNELLAAMYAFTAIMNYQQVCMPELHHQLTAAMHACTGSAQYWLVRSQAWGREAQGTVPLTAELDATDSRETGSHCL